MVVGISMVKDEADIVEATIGWMLTQVDRVIVSDNGSTDGTSDILRSFGEVEVLQNGQLAYYQSERMSELAARADRQGAAWVVPFDADELWYSPFGRLGDVLEEQSATLAEALVYDHVASAVDPDAPPVEQIGWRRREPCPLPKVACRPSLGVTIAQGNHGAFYPAPDEAVAGQIVVRHFPHRSPEQLIRKVRNGAAAYAATDLPEDQGKHWREWGKMLDESGEGAIEELFRTWYWSADPESDSELIFDPAPCIALR